MPFFNSKPFYVKYELFEYAHAVIGAINGLCIAFVLSYNGALAKIGMSSVKDFIFIINSGDSTSLNIASLGFQTGLAAWLSFTQKISIEKEIDNKQTTDETDKIIGP